MASSLIVVLIQLIFTCAAGWLLWKAWRRLAAVNARAGLLIGAGLIIRALLAQAMYWISYLHLPIARSLQDGDGFWSLALDGHAYFVYAHQLLTHGWSAVVLINKTLPSPVFLQILALFQLLFGDAASVGALLNLFAYLGACAAILRLGRAADGQLITPALIALAALSFGPAVIIWSVQPLKDPFFIFAVTAFVAACTLWQEAWRGRLAASRFVEPLLLMLIIMYTVAGIRWYFAFLLWIASLVFFAAATWRSNRRVVAAVTNAIVFFALALMIIFAGGPYVKRRLGLGSGEENRRPSLAAAIVESRENFDRTHVNTMITSGTALQKVDEAPPVRIAEREIETAPKQIASPPTGSLLPQSTFTRVIAGLTAVVLPHFIGEHLGLIHIGGGRGLWAIVETDTLVFDALLLLALYYTFGTLARGAWRNPSFWLVTITTAGITILLAYTISNFGTLFRHRAMIFIGLCLMLVVARETPRDPVPNDVGSES